ncbi:hypothetical protein FT688_20885 [Aeromonas hydrophila]|nr:hypothetical protein FT688_20885 [Aeromonas hydrophila]
MDRQGQCRANHSRDRPDCQVGRHQSGGHLSQPGFCVRPQQHYTDGATIRHRQWAGCHCRGHHPQGNHPNPDLGEDHRRLHQSRGEYQLSADQWRSDRHGQCLHGWRGGGLWQGGPHGGWGWGWHTIIYADGSIYTDRLYASNGTFTGTVNANNGVLNNVTINENCTIRGTLDADRIVGDVTALIKPSGNFSVVAYKRARNMVCVKPIAGNAVISGSGLIGIYLICRMNGVEQGRALYQSNYPTGINRIPMRVTLQEAFVIPANVNATISFEIVPYGNVSSISEQYVESGSVWLMSLF